VPQSLDRTLLAHAVELAPDGVLIVDHDGRIVYANRSICTLVGADDLIGRNVDSMVPERVRGHHAALRHDYNVTPMQRPMGVGLELGLERDDGTMVPVEISLSPFEHDISDRLDAQRRLSAAHEQLALVGERERIGRDLHDVVLQHLYGMGLTLQATASRADADIAQRLEAVVDDVDRIISEVRTIVFTLGPGGRRGALGQELADVVAQASRVLGFTPGLRVEGPVDTLLSAEVRTEMVASMREALGNVARHAKATQASVLVEIVEEMVVMTVTDNGIGPPESEAKVRAGHGLTNLMARAVAYGGTCTLGPRNGDDGAVLRWTAKF
jgi:two-component system, NarL family, sensor histidine kinase DevS